MLPPGVTSIDVNVQYLRIVDIPAGDQTVPPSQKKSTSTAANLAKEGRVYLTLTVDGSSVAASTDPVDVTEGSLLLDFSNQPGIHLPLSSQSDKDASPPVLRIRLFQNLRSKESEQKGKSPKLVIAAEGHIPVKSIIADECGRRGSGDSETTGRITDVELWSTGGQRVVAVVGLTASLSSRRPVTPRHTTSTIKNPRNPLVAASVTRSSTTGEGDDDSVDTEGLYRTESPQLEGRKLLREITDKFVSSKPAHGRASGVEEAGDSRTARDSSSRNGAAPPTIAGPVSMKEFYDQMQRWSLMCGPYREMYETMHDIAHWKGDTAKTWLFLLVATIACLHPSGISDLAWFTTFFHRGATIVKLFRAMLIFVIMVQKVAPENLTYAFFMLWILPSMPCAAIGFWYLRLINRFQETTLRQRRRSSVVASATGTGRDREGDRDADSSKTGVYDWMQKLQEKQREVELNLQYNQTVTQHGLKMLENFRNINPREALVISIIVALPLTLIFVFLPFNIFLLISIYAVLGYNMLSDDTAKSVSRFAMHHFENIVGRFLARSASARQLVEMVQTVTDDSPRAQPSHVPRPPARQDSRPSNSDYVGVSPEALSTGSADKVRTFVTYENQRWWVTGGWGPHTFAGERSAWSDEYGQFYCPKESFSLPKGPGRWEWASLWYVDRSSDGNVEGWEYAPSFSAANEEGFHADMRRSDVVRRRRWCRRCRMVAGSDQESTSPSTPVSPTQPTQRHISSV